LVVATATVEASFFAGFLGLRLVFALSVVNAAFLGRMGGAVLVVAAPLLSGHEGRSVDSFAGGLLERVAEVAAVVRHDHGYHLFEVFVSG
jgi:hypothetical protein